LYRPAYYAEQEPGAPGAAPREEAEWIVGKNRHGETGIAKVSYAPTFTRFDNLAQDGY
jgi:replicative DNA helicase